MDDHQGERLDRMGGGFNVMLRRMPGFSTGRVREDGRADGQVEASDRRLHVHDEAHVREAKECGIDFVLGVKATDRAALDLLAKHGMGVIAGGLLPGWWGGDGSNAGTMRKARPQANYEAKLAEYLATLDHSAIWMLNLCDEPSALDLPYLGEVCNLVAARTPQPGAKPAARGRCLAKTLGHPRHPGSEW